jgi:fructosamine-3-kinase
MRLIESLERWVPASSEPSLLHGDLWHGNWLASDRGEPYLIDPAVCYGDREYEMAFTELFGGFSSRFYAAYEEAYPLPSGYEERRPLYQLYYLLVHLSQQLFIINHRRIQLTVCRSCIVRNSAGVDIP